MRYFFNAGLYVLIAAALFPFAVNASTFTMTAVVGSNSVCGNHIKEFGEQCDGADLGGSMCSTSGFTGGTLSCNASCQLVFSACTTDADSAAVTSFPAATGGIYYFSDDGLSTTTIIVPAYAYPENLTLEAFRYPASLIEPTRPSPAGTDFVGKVYSLYFLNEEGSVVHTLNKPATIIVPYNDADVAGLDEGSLTAYSMGSGDSEWQNISGSSIDSGHNTVTFSTESFGWFGIFGSPPPQPETESNAPSSSGSSVQINIPLSGISIKGTAQLGETVTLLIDGRNVGNVMTGSDASFAFVRNLSPGDYTVGVFATDEKGNRSPVQNIRLTVENGKITTVDGIQIGPASIPVESPAQAPTENPAENPENPQNSIAHADTNGDGKINLIDFSVLAYWFGRPQPPEVADLNGDGKVDLTDFSILAYYWTD